MARTEDPRPHRTLFQAPDAFITTLHSQVSEHIEPNRTIVVAVSGGPDSVALVVGWCHFAYSMGHQLHVAHFDHGYRSNSNEDCQWTQALAKQLNLPFHTAKAEKSNRFTEESARNQRYAFLEQVAKATEASLVATGHTQDDQVETILMSVLRGTGVHGLRGIPFRRSLNASVDVFRPMLTVSRQTIEAFLEQQQIVPRSDSTNAESKFFRNRLRNELLPYLHDNYSPQLSTNLLRLANHAKRMSRLIGRLAEQALCEATTVTGHDFVELSRPKMQHMEPELVPEVIRLLFEQRSWPRQELGQTELDRATQVVLNDESPSAWCLPAGIRVTRGRHTIRLERQT